MQRVKQQKMMVLLLAIAFIFMIGAVVLDKQGFPEMATVPCAIMVVILFVTASIFSRAFDKSWFLSSATQRKQVVQKAIEAWSKKGIVINMPPEHYVPKVSLLEASCRGDKSSGFYGITFSIETMVGMIALGEKDFIEQGLSMEEINQKWSKVFQDIALKNKKRWIGYE